MFPGFALPLMNRAALYCRLSKADGTPDVRVELEDLTPRKRRKGDLPWLMYR